MEQRTERELSCDEPQEALIISPYLSSSTRQDYKELVAVRESRFGSAHEQKLHRSKL